MLRTTLSRFVDATAGTAAGLAFGALSTLRGRRIFHPDGVAFHARLDVQPTRRLGSRLLDEPMQRPCIVRLSQGVGLPDRVPDILGVAIRVLDGSPHPHTLQDLLFATVLGETPAARHVLAPSSNFTVRPLCTILPVRSAKGLLVLTLQGRLEEGASGAGGLEGAAAAFRDGQLTFQLRALAADPALRDEFDTGPLCVGRLVGGERLGEAEAESLRFNPFNASLGLEPAGSLNALRRRAYAGSQAGRPRPRADATAPTT